MFKKWRITGRNNSLTRGIAAFLCLILLMSSFPALSASAATAVSPGALPDLDPNAWYYTETAGAIRAGLFRGNNEGLMKPEGILTRAEFAVLVYRLFGGEKEAAVSMPAAVTDVKTSDYFYKEAAWAYSKGVINGTSLTTFSPYQTITRQEMCVVMGRAIEMLTGTTLSAAGAPTYTDQASIAPWALDYVKKCSNIGLFNGAHGAFMPTAHATRAEAACILYRYYAETNTLLKVSGFSINFQPDTDYYLCRASDFANCKILEYKGAGTISVSVEQYAGYTYSNYKLGDTLKLGNGRAKVTVTVKNGNSTKNYLIAICDPMATDYAYSLVKVNSSVNLRAEPTTASASLGKLTDNTELYYLKSVGDWCMVQQINKETVGYIHKDYLHWEWEETAMPAQYASAIAALQKAHPNWTFSFMDVGMTYQEALNRYGSSNATYIDPSYYLNEDRIFAFLDVSNTTGMTVEGIQKIWINENTFSKVQAAEYIADAASSLNMNAYYIACRIAQESAYGGSAFAKGMRTVNDVTIQKTVYVNGQYLYKGTYYDTLDLGATYHNFYGIGAYDGNPRFCMVYAANRNWNSVERAIIEGANWVKDQYIDRGSVTPYFFRFSSFKRLFPDSDNAHSYMSDVRAPEKEANILKRAYTDPSASAHFIIPVYQ